MTETDLVCERLRKIDHKTQQEDMTMAGSYEDRDGKIWLDGQLVEWRDAQAGSTDRSQ